MGRALGIGLVVLSTVLYLGLLAVPFAPLDAGGKLALSGALVLTGEVSFWLGAALLGREVVLKYRRLLNPLHWWRRYRDNGKEASQE